MYHQSRNIIIVNCLQHLGKLLQYILMSLKEYMNDILIRFPESGRKADEYGKEIRKLVYQGYSILYRINLAKERVEIVNIFRENLP